MFEYDSFSSITDELVKKNAEMMDRIIEAKLQRLVMIAIRAGETELAYILRDLDMKNIAKTKMYLEEAGYSIEIEQPKPTMTVENNVFRSVISTDNVKLKVRKLIFEI